MADRQRIAPGPGQESVWDYPRPPALDPSDALVEVIFGGETVARSRAAFRVLETSHPPVFYIPPADVRMDLLQAAPGRSFCEFKGAATYWTVAAGGQTAPRAAWSYPEPTPRFASIRDHLAFYPSMMEACRVDGETVLAQAGDFYGGWITSAVVGPFKGGPGTTGW